MKFAVINDMHVSSSDTGYFKNVQRKLVGESERLIRDFVERMNSQEHPEFVVNLGDSIEDVKSREGDLLYFKRAIELLSRLKMPVYFLAGNHDVKTLTQEEIAHLLGYEEMYYSFDEGNFHFVALAFQQRAVTDDPDEMDWIVPEEQLDWLAKDLQATNKSTIVFSHYGLADDDMAGNFWFEDAPHKAVIENRLEVRRILETSRKVTAVISGHQHWNKMLVHNGIPYFTVTSLVENFDNDGVAAEAYTIVTCGEGRIVVDVKGRDPAKFVFELGKGSTA